MLPQASSDLYDAQRRRAALAVTSSRRVWRQIGEDFDSGWPRIAPTLVALVTAGQVGAARDAEGSVEDALAEQDYADSPDGSLVDRAFGGFASDGRDLGSLLYGAVVKARTADATTLNERLDAGQVFLDMAVQQQVADAGRQAASVAIAARPRVGWMRMVNTPCCKRCAILAGRIYRYSQGFQRHPNCDCTMIPVTLANPHAKGAIIGPDDVKDLTQAERKAIGDGADFNRVVNAGRGRRGMATLEMAQGATRLTPEGIYRLSTTRDEALSMLVKYGYLNA